MTNAKPNVCLNLAASCSPGVENLSTLRLSSDLLSIFDAIDCLCIVIFLSSSPQQ